MTKENKILILIIIAIVVAMVSLFVIFNRSGKPVSPNEIDAKLLVRSDSNKIGNGSKVTMVEFGDFQCPACSNAGAAVEKLINEYKDKVMFVYRNFPLSEIHKNALVSAEAAEAAAAQGKFWEMYTKLYANQQQWENSNSPIDFFITYATELGIDVNKFKNDVLANKYSSKINQDINDGKEIGLQGTPTFYINGKLLSNFDYATLKNQLDIELNK